MLITDPHAIDTVTRLTERGVFAGATVTAVEPLHRRSLCYRVRLGDGRSLFVKRRSRATAEQLAASFAFERRLTEVLSERRIRIPAEFIALPADDDEILVTEDLVGYAPLADRLLEGGGTNERWAREVGRRLALLHRTTRLGATDGAAPDVAPDAARELDDDLDRMRLPERLLAALTVIGPAATSASSDGYVEMLALVRHSGILRGLETAIARWTPSCIIHGDVKDDNVLCTDSVEAREPVVFVDWESAGYGDPRWDLGCLIGDFLSGWLTGLDFHDGSRLAEWIAGSVIPFTEVLAEIRAAVDGYESITAVTDDDRRQWMRYAAFFLLDRLAAVATASTDLPPHAYAYLQLAEQLALKPDDCLELIS